MAALFNKYEFNKMTNSESVNFWRYIVCLISQIILFLLLHYLTTNYFVRHDMYSKRDISWGLGVQYIFYEFVAVYLLQFFMVYKFHAQQIILSIIASVGIILLVMPYFSLHPFRTLHIGLEGLFCIWVYSMLSFLGFIKN